MSVSRIAARYAKPILELAVEKNVLEDVKQDMQNFTALYHENRDFFLMLNSPIIPHLRKAEILRGIFKGKVNDLTLQSVDIIARKNRGNMLGAIADEFLEQYNRLKGLQNVSITSSIKLSSDQLKSIEKISKDLTGKDPVIEEHIDPEIIGGYILKVGDKQIDQSVSGRLKDIKLKLQTK